MQEKGTRLIIHTSAAPQDTGAGAEATRQRRRMASDSAGKVVVFGEADGARRRQGGARGLWRRAGRRRTNAAPRRARGARRTRRRLTFGERLLRNSAVACSLLLALLAAKNIDAPWTRAAVEGVERALTMQIDLDGSLGQLSFVRDLMPESMLVFFDLSGEGELAAPVEGELDKAFEQERPWVEFACEPGAEVRACADGTVLAVTQLSGGGWGVLIEHGDQLETVSAYLLEPLVRAGEAVQRGQAIAHSEAGRVYLEARRAGELIDPAELMNA